MQARNYGRAERARTALSVLVGMTAWCWIGVAQGLTPTPTPTATPFPCVGDCNQDGQVRIDDLLTMVGIALDGVGASACRGGDRDGNGAIEINEIIDAVNAALRGCSASPSPTYAPTPSPIGTPASVCGNGKIESPEVCDDGNTVVGDGCSNCLVELGFTCVREPSFCYILNCGVANPTCSGGPSARSISTPPPPGATPHIPSTTATGGTP